MKHITLYSIGISEYVVNTAEHFFEIMLSFNIQCLIDIRSLPESTTHFNRDKLQQLCENNSIIYHWAGYQLGEQQQRYKTTQHLALAKHLQTYADYMESDTFQKAAVQLIHLATKSKSVLLSDSQHAQHCHRGLIADYLLLKGIRVIHIQSASQQKEHQLSRYARRESVSLIYDRH